MPIDVGSAAGSVDLDLSGIEASLRRLENALDRLADNSKKRFDAAGDAAEKGFFKRVQDGAGKVEKSLSGVTGALGRISPVALLGLGAGFSAAAGLAIKSSLAMNATLETTELQFKTLIGSADEAHKHVAGLFEFAKETPFETGPIIEASRMMRTFGGAALDTEDNLRLIGDAAAATSAPINEVGFWVGRLYSNLQGGQPFGEAAMRLQELAILSPQARQQMEELQKSGASASEVFALLQGDMGRFTGAMEEQAGTWSGLISTIKDSVQLALAEGLRPFFDEGKKGLAEIVELLGSEEVTAGIQKFAADLGQLVATVAPLAVKYGPALLKVLGGLVALLVGLLTAAKVASAVMTLSSALAALQGILAGAAGASGLLGGALALLTGPVGLIIAAVGLLGVAWAKNWGGIRDKTAEAVGFVKDKLGEAKEALRDFLEGNGIDPDSIIGRIRRVYDMFVTAVKRDFERAGKIIKALLAGDGEEAGRLMAEGVREGLKTIAAMKDEIAAAFKPVVLAIVRELTEVDWNAVGQRIRQDVEDGLQGKGSSSFGLNALKSGPYWLVGKIIDAAPAIYDTAFDIGYGFGEELKKGFEDSTTDAWLERSLAEQADALDAVQGAAESADRALLGYYQTEVRTDRATDDATRGLKSYQIYLRMTEETTKLSADRSFRFADALAALEQKASYVARSMEAARQAQEKYNSFLAEAQGDYAHDLPGSDKPLITPARTVSVTTGGLTDEQKELLETYRTEVEKLEEKVFDLTHGIGTFGVEQEKVNKQLEEAQGEIEHYRQLMGPLENVTGEVSTSQQGLSVNVNAVHQAIYEQLLAMPDAADEALAFAGATGILSEAQMQAALMAAAVKAKIEELAGKIAEGLPIDQALADLDEFVDKINNGVDPATVTLADTVPQRVMDMKDAMAENGMTAGQAVPESIADGINDTLITAETAAEDAATAIIDIMRTTFGVESPSTVLSEIGGNLMLGLDEGMDGEADTVTGTAERIGQAIIKAFDETIGKAPAVGKAIIDGIVAGVEANRGSLIEKMKEIAKAAYAAAMTELDAHSPSRVFMTVGDAIIAGIIEGLDRSEDELYDKLQSVAETLHGIAEGVFNLQSDALQLDIEAADSDLLKALTDMRWKYLLTPEQLDTLSNADPTQLPYILRQLKQDPNFQTEAAAAALEEAIQLADQRNALEQEYIHQQEELKALEQARQQLDFLGYQVELLNLIKDNSLDASILDGLELGLDANMTDIIAAMTAAVQQLIQRTEEELDIASPSGVFEEIGANIMRGLEKGIADSRPVDEVLAERWKLASGFFRKVELDLERGMDLGIASPSVVIGGASAPDPSAEAVLAKHNARLMATPNQTINIFGGWHEAEHPATPEENLRRMYFTDL